MTWYQWLCLFGIPSIMSGLFFMLFNFVINGKKARQKRREEELESFQKAINRLETKFDTTINEMRDSDTILKRGVQALLRNNLYELYNKSKKEGYATIDEKNNFDNMYKQYHDLGKNGVMDSLYNEYMALPTEKPVKKTTKRQLNEKK